MKTVSQLATTIKGKVPPDVCVVPTARSMPYLMVDGLRGGSHVYTEATTLPTVSETDTVLIADGFKSGDAVRGISGALGSTLLGVRPRPGVDASFLFHTLASLFPYLNGTFIGTSVRHLDQGLLAKLPLAVPPPDEQAAIARILDAADTALERTRAAVERARELERSLLEDAFERLGAPRLLLREFTSDVRYGTSKASDPRGWGNPVLRIPNVIGDRLNLADLSFVELSGADVERLQLEDGDLLMVRTNGNPNYVGRSVVFRRPDARTWVYASYLIRVRLKAGLLPDFVNLYLGLERGRRELLRRVTTSAGNNNINSNSIRLLNLPVPTTKAAQSRTVELGIACRAHVDSLLSKVAALDVLKNSLMHDLLTGRVRVPDTSKVAAS